MKGSKLRIGNLVKYKTGEIVEISGILNAGLYVKGWAKGCLSMSQFSGIPLTEELLLNFGFNNSLVSDIFLYEKIEFPPTSIIRDNGFFYFRKGGLQIITSTVHQLQNLYFALTGEELTIK